MTYSKIQPRIVFKHVGLETMKRGRQTSASAIGSNRIPTDLIYVRHTRRERR